MPTISALPTRASAIPPVSPKSAAELVRKATEIELIPLTTTVPSTSARIATAKSAAEQREDAHQLLGAPAAPEPVRVRP